MTIDINYLVDKKLPFLRKIKNLEIIETFNLFQLFQQRFGIGKNISKKIIINLGVHLNTNIVKYPNNIINKEIKYIFLKSEELLDIPLERQMIKSLQKNVDLYNYRGSRYKLRLPLNGQRRRANGKTTKKVRLLII
jgi:small subunit ribosomal protein S13